MKNSTVKYVFDNVSTTSNTICVIINNILMELNVICKFIFLYLNIVIHDTIATKILNKNEILLALNNESFSIEIAV